MNRLWLPRSPRLLAGLTVAATVLLLGGCLKKNIVWSPDGQQAAVISQDGLRFCGADGALSSPSSPGVYLVAWLGDSQHLLVARERPAANWAEVARVLGSERTQQIAAAVEAAWAKVKQGALWSVVTLDLLNENPLPQFCLRELHGSELRPKLSTEEWAALTGVEVKLHEVALARRQDGRVELGTPLFTDLGMVADLRLAPGEKAVAITVAKSARNGDHHRLVVAALDGAVPPAALANEVSASPDWAIDGRALVYCQSPGLPEKDQVQFGVFQQREVLGPDGKLAPAEKAVDLGGGLFQPLGRIRCLPDGRIVFNASELTLPVAARDFEAEREQLFVLDPTRQATLVRLTTRSEGAKLPKMLAFFEPSADGKTLLIGGGEGEVCVFTLATGEITEIQGSGKGPICQPVWRGLGELTYLKRVQAKEGQQPSREVEVVLRKGDKETVLSATWPDAVVESLGK